MSGRFVRMGNPENHERDCVWEIDGREIRIDVATAYYSDQHACFEWAAARSQGGQDEVFIHEPDKGVLEVKQNIIHGKCTKRYQGAGGLWLLVEVKAELADRAPIDACLRSLCVPEKHNFGLIYLLHNPPSVASALGVEKGGDRVAELFPHRGGWT